MQAEEFKRQTLELEGWSVHLSSYRIGGQFLAEIEVESSGVTIARAIDQTRSVAEERAVQAAAGRLTRTRRLDFDLTVGG